VRWTGPDPSSVRLPGPWTHRNVSANGIRLHVAECDGGGPLVVLLHGFPEFWWSWRHQIAALAERGYRVVAADLRGYGDSDKPPRGYDLWTLAGDVAGLVRALGEPRAHLVGHDWGGLVAWTVTALHPRLVRSLTALAAPHPLALRSAMLRNPRGQGRATARYALGFQLPRWPERSLLTDDGARVERIMRAWAGPEWAASADFAAAAAHYRSAVQVPGTVHSAMEYYRWAARSQLPRAHASPPPWRAPRWSRCCRCTGLSTRACWRAPRARRGGGRGRNTGCRCCPPSGISRTRSARPRRRRCC
jgi:pimeloyl-ACP methyl ester carboxylesterase